MLAFLSPPSNRECMDAFAGDIEWLGKYSRSPQGKYLLCSIVALFDHTYWTRLWIFQEVVLAWVLILVCGSRTIQWPIVSAVMTWIDARGSRYTTADSYRRTISGFQWTTVVQKDSKADVDVELRLRMIYSFASNLQTSHPKDYIYGLEGMTGLGILADYSENKTVAEVYQEYAALWLLGLSELKFLDMAGVGFLWEETPGLPSWTPNFKGIAEGRDSTRLKALVCDTFYAVRPYLVSSTLHCTGGLISPVFKVGSPVNLKPQFNVRDTACTD
ncbi:hypothetical protein BDV95DRAFT_182719 [Massariosphaeria phaeospora]|uniref:Heterokaryon incompatibility domain-containing protein n=1 Tax=Massariosphaeria phaeospora TaxID=100035 RepID=A0A7C8MH98_9PLEO|nr:hypothetical protein BDV95DRAFT_182719 [Massariosphaeria phaeospora]